MINKRFASLSAAILFASLLFIGGTAYFLQSERAHRHAQRAEATKEVQIHARLLERQFDNLMSAPTLLAGLLRKADGERDVLTLTEALLRLREGVSTFQLAQASGRVLTYPPDATPPAPTSLRAARPSPAESAIVVPGAIVAAGPPQIVLEADAVVARQPVAVGSAGGQLWGVVVATARVETLIAASRLDELADLDRYDYRLTYHPAAGGSSIFLTTGRSQLEDPVSYTVRLPNGESMTLAAVPKGGWRGSAETLVQLAVLATAWILITVLLHRMLRQPELLRREVELRARELAGANASLQKEMLERAEVERALRRSHALLDSVFDHIPFMVLVKRADDLGIVRANRYSEVILGRDRASLGGSACCELLPKLPAERLAALDREVLHSRQPAAIPELRIEMWDDQPHYLHVKAIPLLNPEGEAEYVLQLAEDITERKRLQDALSDQLHFLEQLLDAIPSPIYFKDAQRRYMGCNSAFERFLGRPRDEIVGMTVYDVAPKELAEIYERADMALIDNPGTQVYETQLAAADGLNHDVMFHKATFLDRNGGVGGIVGVFLDITEHKTAERHIVQLNRTLTVLTEINEAIFRMRDRQDLLDRACEILVDKGEFPLAWIYFAEEPGQPPRVFSAKGAATKFASRALETLADGQLSCPLPGLSSQPDAALICNTMDCCQRGLVKTANALGFASLAILPLRNGDRCIGGLGIFGAQPNVFGEHETRLLRELADDLSYALEAIYQEERRKTAEQDLCLAARVFENSLEGIMVTDAENRILMVNKAFSTVTGYQPQDVIGKNPRVLSSGQQDPEFYREMWRSLRHDGEWHGEVKNRRKSGEFYPEWLTISVVKNDEGKITNHVAVFADITSRKRIEERLNFLAHYDVLTELPNRVLFVDRLDQSVLKARNSGKRVGVMFMDLDRFKLINETFGQSAGDLLLMEVSRRLSGCLRNTDSASRLGGDEFAIVLSEIDSMADAAAVAQCVLDALARSFQLGGRDAYTSASIGISLFPEDGHDSQSLAKNAEAAMYRAMDEGGNKCHFYHQEMNARSSERMSMEAGLRHAIERGELILHYQPVVEAATGRIVGAEALVRWDGGERGFVPPQAFVPLLEETKLIIPVGEWILRTACKHNRQWRQATGSDLIVCVNFSAIQLAESDIVQRIRASLDELDFDPRHLEIELTESAIMRDTERAIGVMRQLKDLGLRLSIDDFGTGYSSLSYLKRFPFDTLKIDRSFVCDTPGDAETTAIIRAIIAMGHSLDMNIIAEGVETPEQINYLRGVDCDLLQGWGLSPALPHEKFLELLGTKLPRQSPASAAPRLLDPFRLEAGGAA